MAWNRHRIPIAVPPLPGEALDSWIEAYARRLRTTPRHLWNLIAMPQEAGWARNDYTICLHPAEATHLARRTGVPPAQLHAMTLRHFSRAVAVDEDKRAVVPWIRWGRVT